jgi:hypothetical protein
MLEPGTLLQAFSGLYLLLRVDEPHIIFVYYYPTKLPR